MQDKSLGPKSIIGKLQTVQDNFQFAQHSRFLGFLVSVVLIFLSGSPVRCTFDSQVQCLNIITFISLF